MYSKITMHQLKMSLRSYILFQWGNPVMKRHDIVELDWSLLAMIDISAVQSSAPTIIEFTMLLCSFIPSTMPDTIKFIG